ncbi:hypothetical protein LOZ36_000759 [Ophidiomyces ophidiicola]|nr:hypothetical protein LOZ36_000759 [Ophidiomyces ophidiicola]
MSQPSINPTAKILQFAENCKDLESHCHQQSLPPDPVHYNTQLDEAIKELRDRAEAQESILQELRAKRPLDLPQPNLDALARLAQTHRATHAYQSLLNETPQLPTPNSPLNTLLTLRQTFRLVQELKSSISAAAQDLVNNRERLKTEEANLRDARMITEELQKRLENLQRQQEQESGRQKKPQQIAKELIANEEERKAKLEQSTAELKDSLKRFIDDRLSPMLAAEDLGGPVVGDQIDISDSTLEVGYTAHGKERKPKKNAETSLDSRQQRIDTLVRSRMSGVEGHGSADSSKRQAAATKMHTLIDKLLDVAGSSSYVELQEDSAASRFLLKAKIAQFHPRDSRKIRLINVARDILD